MGYMKKIFYLYIIILMLTGCSKETSGSGLSGKAVPAQSAQQKSSASDAQAQEGTEGFWKESAVNNAQEENILGYANGLQIILPKEWDGEIVASAGDDNTLTVADKRNVEKGAGGVMFYLAYFEKKGVSAKYPYAIDKGFDTVLGTYKVNGEEYALIQELPTEMNYVEGDEELEKHYEDLYASVEKVQIITDKMPGFTKCGIDDLNWIIYNTYEQMDTASILDSSAPTAESVAADDNSRETEAANKEDMTRAAEEKEIVEEGFHNKEHSIYMGTIGNIEVRVGITRTDNTLSAAYITRADEEKDFTGKIENNSANFALYAVDDDFLKGKIDKNGDGVTSIEGQGRVDGKSVDFALYPDTFFPIGNSADNYYSAIGYSAKEAEQFVRKIKDTVNDKEAFTKIILYPISVDLDGRNIVIKNQEEMLNQYDKLMAQNDFKKQVEQIFTKYMFANYQGICIESGLIWCNKDSAGDYKITAINTHG